MNRFRKRGKVKKATPEDEDNTYLLTTYLPRDIPGPIPEYIEFSFGGVVPESRERINCDYDMNYWPHGIALIINNIRFESSEKRDGAELDEQNLVTLFKYLGYIVEVHRDCKADMIRDIMKEMKKRDHSNYDSFVCCLMSHGSEGTIAGTDDEDVTIKEIGAHLNGKQCESLAGKPKMFFIQACRGQSYDRGISTSCSTGDNKGVDPSCNARKIWIIKIPIEADFLFSYATPPGYYSHRADNGSWYISELCRSLARYARVEDLIRMLENTNDRVGREYATSELFPKREAPEFESRLTKRVFFFRDYISKFITCI